MSVLTLILAGALSVLSPWKNGELEIHHIATGNGDCTLFIMPDGTTMMIDAGVMKEDCTIKDMRSAGIITDYVKHFCSGLPGKGNLDYFLLTHFHSDHMGLAEKALPGKNGYMLSGTTELTEHLKIRKIIDRAYPAYDFSEETYGATKRNTGFLEEYIKWVRYQVSECGAKAEGFVIGSKDQFIPVNGTVQDFSIQNLACSGRIWTGKGLKYRQYSTDSRSTYDENMMSCAIVLRYGKFSYLNTGDTPGSNWWVRTFDNGEATSHVVKANDKTELREFEQQLADIAGPVTAMKLGHHGTPDNTTGYALWKLRPQVMCAFGSAQKQPCPVTLRRIQDPQLPCAHKLFVTTDAAKQSNGAELWDKTVNPVGHIIIKVKDKGSRYQVFVLGAKDQRYEVIYSSEEKIL